MTAPNTADGLVIQGFTPPLALADFRLIAFDMDSTLINIECIDEIADAAGRKAEVAAITEAAMRGEITDYKDSLRRRVALLRGLQTIELFNDPASVHGGTWSWVPYAITAVVGIVLAAFFVHRLVRFVNSQGSTR